MRKHTQKQWNNGLTLVETLAAAAILVILLGAGSVAAAYYRDYLKIAELDNAAREIYMAAQHRAVLLSGSHRLGGLVENEEPVQLSAAAAEGGIGYCVSSENISADLLAMESIDPTLRDGYFYVFYEPVSGSVTDVFYAEEPIETLVEIDLQMFYDQWTEASRTQRMRAKPMLGHYGGGMAEGDDSRRLPTPDVTVQIHNQEKLTVEVTFRVPGSSISGIQREKWVSLRYGGARVDLIAGEDQPPSNWRLLSRGENAAAGTTTYVWVLDSLEEGDGQFKDLFGGVAEAPDTYGGDLTVSAAIRLSAAGYRSSQSSASDSDNSLFAKGSGGETANIRLLRHLQNLDSGFSGVGGKTGAEQQDRIDGDGNGTYPGYEFRPIENAQLTFYDGKELEIHGLLVTPESAGGKPAGLFSSAGDKEGYFRGEGAFSFRNIRLVNTAVDAGPDLEAGALAGKAEYAVFDNCRVYWETTEEHPDLRELLGSDAEDGGGYHYQIKGSAAGGLVGRLDRSYAGPNTIDGCFAATLVEGRDAAGGLLGAAAGTLDVTGSYADCYLSGRRAAGVVGALSADLSLQNCYTAGFLQADEKAAGLCLGTGGKTSTENVYSTMYHSAAAETGGGAAFYGLTELQGLSEEGGFQNTYYLEIPGQEPGGEAWGRDYVAMTNREGTFLAGLGGAYDWKTAPDTQPYNLREHLTLTSYSFPGLAGLPHYGDWVAQFQPSLVYYEEYEVTEPGQERYGFSGGNARYLSGIGELQNQRTILLDGYAVAVRERDLRVQGGPGDTGPVRIQVVYRDADGRYWDGGAHSWVSGTDPYKAVYSTDELVTKATWENEMYYLIPLPEEMVNDGGARENFFRYLSFELTASGIVPVAGEFFYDPHFAETVIPYEPEETAEGGTPPVWNGEAADRYAGEELVEKGRRNTANIRTPRHLYALSTHREYYSNRRHRYIFRQELHLEYGRYTGYGLFTGQTPFRQAPIGSWSEPFLGVYNGGCRTIRGVTFFVPEDSERFYAGLFGYSAGTLRDIVYKMDAQKALSVAMGDGYHSLYVGALAGGNAGTISNCAVSGVALTGRSFGSTIYVGGLVGQNSGVIRNSAAECAALSADCSSYAAAYVGGLTGRNETAGELALSYAVGKVTAVIDRNSRARICGFVGYNTGSVWGSYAAVQLDSTGEDVEIYGFCGMRGGSQTETFYLDEGSFTYRETSYAADYYREDDRAVGVKYATLTGGPFSSLAREMTAAAVRDEDTPGGTLFPYPTGVRNANGQPIHYGRWPALMDLGDMGLYYWEELVINGRSKFHISALAVDTGKSTVTKRSNLSLAHDDGGVVTCYGYGYYTKAGVSIEGLTTNSIYYSTDNGGTGSQLARNRAPTSYEAGVNEELADQNRIAEGEDTYTFHSYQTFGLNDKGGLYPYNANAAAPNSTLRLTGRAGAGAGATSITFTLNPLFADAMSVELPGTGWSVQNGAAVTGGAASPGRSGNVYGVRCIEQLQFINWNSANRNTTTRIVEGTAVGRFPYLSNSAATGNYYWTQSHDIQGRTNTDGSKRYYTPIAEYYDATADKTGVLNAWFRGTYDGDDYVIENVNIKGQQSSCAGLFGIVYNGALKNIVLFSGEVVSYKNESGQSQSCWYAIGGLAGLAAADGENASAIQNCSVAGYRIDADVRMRRTGGDQNWGGAEIGGLVGISFMDMEKCAAETTIVVPAGIQSLDNLRIGGLAGASQKTISNSYAGGEIQVAAPTIVPGGSIYIGGIVGGSYFKPLDPSAGDTIGTVASDSRNDRNDTTNNALFNCYSYVTLPARSAAGNKNGQPLIQSLYALGGTGEISSAAETAGANWDNKANHGVCTIENCYYLGSKTLANNDGGITGIKTDVDDTANVIDVTYRQLSGKDAIGGRGIYQRLNRSAGSEEAAQAAGPFYPVTSQVDGYSVAGKYSYPPDGGTQLNGLNYPFPTVLTREDGAYHVHYGAWPLNGIVRDDGGAPVALDLYTKQTHTETLTLTGVSGAGQWTVTSGNGSVATGTVTPAGRLTVTAVGEGATTLTVGHSAGGDPLTVTVNVTAHLELRPSAVSTFPGSRVELAMVPWGRTPITAAGTGGEYQALSAQGLEILSATSGNELILAEAMEMSPSHVLLTVAGDAPVSAVASMVNVGYLYTHKTTEQPHALAVTVLAPPQAAWTGSTCTIDFSGTFGGHDFTVQSAALPEGSAAAVRVAGDTVILENVPEGRDAPELTIVLTETGPGGSVTAATHTVVMSPARPAKDRS